MMLNFKIYDPSTRKFSKKDKTSTYMFASIGIFRNELNTLEESNFDSSVQQVITENFVESSQVNSNYNTEICLINIIADNTEYINLSLMELLEHVDQELNCTTSRVEKQ